MYNTLKQYVIKPFTRLLFGEYELQERMREFVTTEKYRTSRINLDEICWNELNKGTE